MVAKIVGLSDVFTFTDKKTGQPRQARNIYIVRKPSAREHGYVGMVKYAIRLGANVNAVDNNGMTPLMYSCKYGVNYEVIELLLWHGADVNIRNPRGKRQTAFDMLLTSL